MSNSKMVKRAIKQVVEKLKSMSDEEFMESMVRCGLPVSKKTHDLEKETK